MNNDINELRTHLFDTLRQLKDKDNPMELDRAKAVVEVGQVIINSAKAEIDFMRANGNVDTQFFHRPELGLPAPRKDALDDDLPEVSEQSHSTASGVVSIDHRNGNRILTHRMK